MMGVFGGIQMVKSKKQCTRVNNSSVCFVDVTFVSGRWSESGEWVEMKKIVRLEG